MKRNLSLWQFAGFIFTCVVGTLLHFLYDWLGGNVIAAVFSSVNESTWEHMKILFIPMFLFSIFEKHLIGIELKNYWCVKLWGILMGIISIPILFYSYNGIFGRSSSFINIAIFYISAAISYFMEYRMFKKEKKRCFSQTMAFSFLCIIALTFLIITFVQPRLPIFKDPLSGEYGIG